MSKTLVLSVIGCVYGLALLIGGGWAIAFGVLILYGCVVLMKQIADEHRDRDGRRSLP